MITISTQNYTTEQIKYLAEGLSYAANLMFDSPECQKYTDCTSACKARAICYDLCSTREYLWEKIKEREALESISRM